MSWWSRLGNALRSEHLDQDLDDEQRFHIESRAEDLEREGLSHQAALEQASRQFGHRLLLREASRDVRIMPRLESLGRDLRLGLRLLYKDAVVSSAAVISLGLAIGACTAAFSLIDAVILRPLPVREPDRLVVVTKQTSLVGNTLLRERLLAVLSGFFAALGLVLAAVGLYGVLSYAVVRRTREIGIRMALGAQAMAVMRSIAGRVALAIAAGVVSGLAGGLYFARFVESFLYETEPVALSSLGVPVLCLLIVACVATWSPIRRAIRVDPVEALRTD